MTATDVQLMIKKGLGDHLTSGANSDVWSLSQALSTAMNKEIKKKAQEAVDAQSGGGKNDVFDESIATRLATDPDFAKGWMIQELARTVQSDSGNTQAAKELRDLLAIGSKESELKIEVVDFSTSCNVEGCPLKKKEKEAE